jgi:MFS transporter (putative signal transducer)
LITLLASLLPLPWAFKFLWAPVVDTCRSVRWTYRSWILLSQGLMGLTLIPLIFVDSSASLTLIFICLIAHAMFAATQDVAIDALCVSLLPAEERGRANGWMQAGMLLGRSMFGGGTLILLSAAGLRGVVLILVGLLAAIAWVVARSDSLADPVMQTGNRETPARSMRRAFSVVLRTKRVWFGLGYAAVAGAVFEGLGSVAGPFLIDSGLTEAGVGSFFALPVVLAMSIGALLGGAMSDRMGAFKSVRLTYAGLFGAVMLLSVTVYAGAGSPVMTSSLVGLVYLGIGFFTASTYAMFMDVTVDAYRGTSFSAYMGATNLCESWSAFSVGKLVVAFGYGPAFGVLAAVSVGSLLFLRRLRDDTPLG